MVECGLPKPETRVRFPSPAPLFSSANSQFFRALSYECHTKPPGSVPFPWVFSPGIELEDRQNRHQPEVCTNIQLHCIFVRCLLAPKPQPMRSSQWPKGSKVISRPSRQPRQDTNSAVRLITSNQGIGRALEKGSEKGQEKGSVLDIDT